MRNFVAITGLLLLAGCGKTNPVHNLDMSPEERDRHSQKDLLAGEQLSITLVKGKASRAKEVERRNLWANALDVLGQHPFEMVDQESGVIQTKWISDANGTYRFLFFLSDTAENGFKLRPQYDTKHTVKGETYIKAKAAALEKAILEQITKER